jgi:hypothetical protein
VPELAGGAVGGRNDAAKTRRGERMATSKWRHVPRRSSAAMGKARPDDTLALLDS